MIAQVILSIALAFAIHETAHYLTALLFGHRLAFRRQGLRFIWDMPEDTKQHQRLIAISGFGAAHAKKQELRTQAARKKRRRVNESESNAMARPSKALG